MTRFIFVTGGVVSDDCLLLRVGAVVASVGVSVISVDD